MGPSQTPGRSRRPCHGEALPAAAGPETGLSAAVGRTHTPHMADAAFLPLHTGRLTLRAFTPADAPVFAAYRNDPEVARYQDWALPVSHCDAEAFVAEQRSVTGPELGAWVQLAVEHAGELAGDLAVHLDDTGELATIGYTLRSGHQGRGLAREAVSALVDALLEHAGVHRIAATTDPRNIASARLLEDLGFRYEGQAKAAALVRGAWEDDDRYALLRADRQDWLARPTGRARSVHLVEITRDNLRAVGELATHHSQERFVSTMSGSFRDALFPGVVNGAKVVPWLRAIADGPELAGFLMLAEATTAHPEPYLWRLLVDRRHQRRGIGSQALAILFDKLRADGHSQIRVSWVDGSGGPRPFYQRLGFVPTGKIIDGEVEATCQLT
jgi:RimJ/RimL family protein N-acetyltransferase